MRKDVHLYFSEMFLNYHTKHWNIWFLYRHIWQYFLISLWTSLSFHLKKILFIVKFRINYITLQYHTLVLYFWNAISNALSTEITNDNFCFLKCNRTKYNQHNESLCLSAISVLHLSGTKWGIWIPSEHHAIEKKTASWDKNKTREAIQGPFGLTGTQLESSCNYLMDKLLRNVINAKNISTDKKAERGNYQKQGET
jgi:hypothetical protein